MMTLLFWLMPAQGQSVYTSQYIQAEIYDALMPSCKLLFPQKKMLYSSRLQSWKTTHGKAISKGREDMINLATMLGQSEQQLTQQKVYGAQQQFQRGDNSEKAGFCHEIEQLK